MSEARNRGEGNMADALRTRRRKAVDSAPEGSAGSGSRSAYQRRGRRKTTKRGNPEYMQATAYVRRDVYERVRQALLSGEVKREVLVDLADQGVLHQAGKPNYSDLVELLLRDWLDRFGWEMEV